MRAEFQIIYIFLFLLTVLRAAAGGAPRGMRGKSAIRRFS